MQVRLVLDRYEKNETTNASAAAAAASYVIENKNLMVYGNEVLSCYDAGMRLNLTLSVPC